MTKDYVGAPELTRAAFIDGWHHTNDFGFRPSEDKLVVLGRADDTLNIGGIKVAPGPIEERLKAIDGIRDALVIGIGGDFETAILLVAVETEHSGDVMWPRRLLAPIIEEYCLDFQLLVLSEFPRTETGKICRDQVRELHGRQAAREASHRS